QYAVVKRQYHASHVTIGRIVQLKFMVVQFTVDGRAQRLSGFRIEILVLNNGDSTLIKTLDGFEDAVLLHHLGGHNGTELIVVFAAPGEGHRDGDSDKKDVGGVQIQVYRSVFGVFGLLAGVHG